MSFPSLNPALNPQPAVGNRLFRPWQSQAPKAMNAFYQLLLNVVATMPDSPEPPDVHFGPFMGESSSGSTIQVGWQGFIPGYQYPSRTMSETLYSPVLTSTLVEEGLGPSMRETFEFANASLYRSGSTSEKERVAATQAVYDNLQIPGQVLMSGPPFLSGTVAHAVMATPVNLHMVQDRRGFLAVLVFSVRCTAYAQQ